MKLSRKFWCFWVLYLTEEVNLLFAELASREQADKLAGGALRQAPRACCWSGAPGDMAVDPTAPPCGRCEPRRRASWALETVRFCVSAGERLLGKRLLSALLAALTCGVLCLWEWGAPVLIHSMAFSTCFRELMFWLDSSVGGL